MTLVGSMHSGNGRSAVVDQWGQAQHQTIAKVPASAFGNTSRRYALWVTGTIGPTTGWQTVGVSSVRIALQAKTSAGALVGGWNARDFCEWKLHDVWLEHVGTGVPFQFLVLLDPSATGGSGFGDLHPNWSAGWPAGADLHVVGWLQNTSGPQQGVAIACDVSVIVWDLEAVEAYGAYTAYDSWVTPAPRLNPLGTISYRDLELAAGTPALLGDVGDRFLCFWSATYQPYAVTAPWLELRARRVGAGTETVLDRLGMVGTVYASLGTGVNFGVLHAHGGVAGYVKEATTENLRLLGQDNYLAGQGNTAGGQTIVHGVACLAIPEAALYELRIDQAPTPLPTHFTTLPTAWLPWSFTIDRSAAYHVLHQGRAKPTVALPDYGAYRPRMQRGDQTSVGGAAAATAGGTSVLSLHDRVPAYVGYPISMLSGYDVGVRHAFEAIPQRVRTLAAEFATSVGFGFDPNPGNGDPPAVEVGEVVAIVPGYEALDAGDLAVLPFELEAQYEESIDAPTTEFTATTGYRWQLPAFTRLRGLVRGAVSNLTATERDTLLEFLAAHRVFAWTPKGESAPRAWLQLAAPDATQSSATHWTVALDLAELVYTAP